MKKTKSMIILGDFKGQNIFFDKKTKNVYSIKVEQDFKVNIKWPVVGVGIVGNVALSAYENIYYTDSRVQFLVFLIGLLLTSFIANFIFLDRFRNVYVSEFHPETYLEWPLFLQKEKDRLIIVLSAIIFTGFLLYLQVNRFLMIPSMGNYFLSLSMYLLFYMSLFKSQFFHRVRAYRILKQRNKNKT